ncbi:MAG: DUF4139 domain-containing protein [Phycisphaerales bacterium]
MARFSHPTRIARLSALALSLSAGLAAALGPSTSITVYSSASPGAIDANLYRPGPGAVPAYYGNASPIPGYAMVREDREIDISALGEARFADVAAFIDPTTVQFTSLGKSRLSVLEQDYRFDLVSPEKLLEKALDKDVRLVVQRGTKAEFVDGTLLSVRGGQLVVRTSGGVEIINGYLGAQLLGGQGDLMTRPTLLWKLDTDEKGPQPVRVSYQTEGITWWADYNLTFTEGKDANSGTLDIAGWASILNQSGATYSNARLKLVAGDVHRAPKPQAPDWAPRSEAVAFLGADAQGFAEKSFFEYHLYTLGREATIPDNSTKQLELFPVATGVPCEKVIVYDGMGADTWWGDSLMLDQGLGNQSKKDVDVYIRFSNSDKNGMGMPLPAGRVRVSKLDPDDEAMEFIGEDVIRHTPREEQVLIKMGRAFDVVGERAQTDFQLDSGRRRLTETYEIKVRNRKVEPVSVVVQEHMFRWAQWEISKSTVPHAKVNSRLVHFPLTLKPDEEGVVRYTVTYTW